ncbi:MAG: hypothetical protein SO072_01855 [Dysosmobacter sp.]|nr:hypothetical protein [Dysosmobacter sp.]
MAEKILIGADPAAPLYTFQQDAAEIKSCACVLSSALVGDELAIDQFMPVVYHAGYIRQKMVPAGSSGLVTSDGKQFMCYPGTGFLDKIPYGTPIWYKSGDNLVGKFYTKRILRTGKAYFDILAVSAIGVLDGQDHNGGLYTGQTFATVVADIIGSGYAFSCTDEVASIQIYGWLPIASRRANLHQLLFACGVMLDKDSNGDLYFRFPDSETYKSIPDNRIFLGGSVDYMTPATAAEVTEHAWMQLSTDETVTLFDNTDGSGAAVSTFVAFQQAPVHDLQVSGNLTVESYGVNYAVVSGTGTLTGKKYTHVTKVLRKTVEDPGTEKTVSVTEATLVNIANSENVCQRVLSYYSSARTIQADIVLDRERPGDQISFNNPYNEPEMAFLSSMDVNASSFLRAACELVTGYVPSGGGNNYTQVVVLTGTGNYQFPTGTKKAVAALISAGDGGWSGGKGKNATGQKHFDSERKAGVGGVAGKAGIGGKILAVKLENPTGIFSYSCGAKGLGGVQDGTESSVAGTNGTATTFGPYSSENGQTSATGYVNLFTGEIYALPGRDGIAGGDGSDERGNGPNVIDHNGNVWTPGKNGASFSNNHGDGDGGYGGGAAVGSNGKDGLDGRVSSSGGFGGGGGDGAAPLPGSSAASYGSGGDGGHGGGGGGAGGYGSGNEELSSLSNGDPGEGAAGSDGGNGGDGVIVIYL